MATGLSLSERRRATLTKEEPPPKWRLGRAIVAAWASGSAGLFVSAFWSEAWVLFFSIWLAPLGIGACWAAVVGVKGLVGVLTKPVVIEQQVEDGSTRD